MRRGQLNFTEEEVAAIRDAERLAGYTPTPPVGAGLGIGGGLDLLGTILGTVLTGAGQGLAELGHAIDNFFRALFISAAVALAVGLIVFVLTHASESTRPETIAQVAATTNQPELEADAPRNYKLLPNKSYKVRTHIRVYTPPPSGSVRKLKHTKPALREPRALLDDITTVAPPAPAADDTLKLGETARWESETDEPPVLRRKVFPEPGSPTTVAQVQPRTECQVAPQPEMAHPYAAVKEVEHGEADARPPQPHANKHKVKKPSRLRRALSGVLTFEDFIFNQIDPMAEP